MLFCFYTKPICGPALIFISGLPLCEPAGCHGEGEESQHRVRRDGRRVRRAQQTGVVHRGLGRRHARREQRQHHQARQRQLRRKTSNLSDSNSCPLHLFLISLLRTTWHLFVVFCVLFCFVFVCLCVCGVYKNV